MISREGRLRRLAELRVVQHDVAVTHLRGAQTSLLTAEAAVLQAEAAARHARTLRSASTEGGTTQDWLLACAEAELSSLKIVQRNAARTEARAAVHTAATGEATARRERKQIDVTLERVKREMGFESARAEQRTLDEVARLLKNPLALVTGQHSRL